MANTFSNDGSFLQKFQESQQKQLELCRKPLSTDSSAEQKIANAMLKLPVDDGPRESRKRKESSSLSSVQLKLARPTIPTSTKALRPADVFAVDDDDEPSTDSVSVAVDGSKAVPRGAASTSTVSRSINPAGYVSLSAIAQPQSVNRNVEKLAPATSNRAFKEQKRSSRWGGEEKRFVSAPEHASPAQAQSSSTPKETNAKTGAELELEQLREQMKARAKALLAIERLGLPTPTADSDICIEEEISQGPTWEHRRRQAEIERLRSSDQSDPNAQLLLNGQKRHLGDYLPIDYDEAALRQSRELESDYAAEKLTEQNRGFQLLARMGWTEGRGLGATQQGILAPIKQGRSADDHQGLGATAEAETGDAFDAYRRRMMEAYRHRPNPFKNPRRPY